ncbi:MAG: sensor histidine kinase [Alloprevotella sp.]
MKHVSVWIDLAFCIVLLPLMMYMFPVERWWGIHPFYFSLFVGWLYATYFLYKYGIVPRLCRSGQRKLPAWIALGATLAVTLLFSSFEITSPYYHLRQLLGEPSSNLTWGMRPNRQAVWLHFIIVVTFCFAQGLLNEAYRQRLAREEMENARNKAELDFYKAQINPHFLFNCLNTVYGLFLTRSDKALPTLERFIALVQYTYRNAGRDFIALHEEADYIGRYIAMQQLRLGSQAQVDFDCRLTDGSVTVPPMLLITFVENAFKHGTSSAGPCFVRVALHQAEGQLTLEVHNSLCDTTSSDCTKPASGRMGLANCRKRLTMLYPHRHSLEVGSEVDGTFRVKLVLQTGQSS